MGSNCRVVSVWDVEKNCENCSNQLQNGSEIGIFDSSFGTSDYSRDYMEHKSSKTPVSRAEMKENIDKHKSHYGQFVNGKTELSKVVY